MKKLIIVIVLGILTVGCIACGREDNKDTQELSDSGNYENSENGKNTEIQPVLQITDAKELLTKVWAAYGEDEKFGVVGGHYEAYTEGAPAKYDLTKTEDMEEVFCIPTQTISLVDDAATLQHERNIINFSAAAYHVKEGADRQKLIDDIKNMTLNKEWIYGHPDRLMIFTVGEEYIVTVYGKTKMLEEFQAKLQSVYEASELMLDEAL